MSDTLYIIGNGFDLHHIVPSNYIDFRKFLLRMDRELLRNLETLYGNPDIWSDFENSLSMITRETFFDYLDPYIPAHEVGDDSFLYAHLSFMSGHANTLIDNLTSNLKYRFHQWVKTLYFPVKSECLKLDIDNSAYFISFNYTDFIESEYGAASDMVCYLHGKVTDKLGDIILGHGEEPETNYKSWHHKNRNKRRFRSQLKNKRNKYFPNHRPVYLAYFLKEDQKGNWGSEARYHAIEASVEEIEQYYEKSYKNFITVMDKHSNFISSLNKIKRIIVLGHSLSKVDIPYFKEIVNKNLEKESIQWEISYRSDSSLIKIDAFIKELALDPQNVRRFKLEDIVLN